MYAQGVADTMESEHGIDPMVFPQTTPHFAGPTAAYERHVIAGTMHHNNNPVLTWQAGHVKVKTDINDNRRPIKPARNDHRKIDAIVGGVMGLGAAITVDEDAFTGGISFG
jgi:phage terminase large subunit-like protein